MMRAPARAPRRGLSLLEVLTALTIFLFSLIVISRLASLGTDRAIDVQYLAQAGLMCQSKMAEVQGGAITLASQGDTPLEEDPNWFWSVDCVEGSVAGLWNVTVRVYRDQRGGNRIEATLSQIILDPSMRGSAQDVSAAAAATTDTGTTSGSTTGGTGSGTTGTSTGSGMTSGSGSTTGGRQ